MYFEVRLGPDRTFPADSIVQLDNVKQNVGGGYIDYTNSTNYGKFIIPVNGTYQFIVTIMDAHQANRDLSCERDAALTKQTAKAIAREMAKAHAHFQALLNERSMTAMPTSLNITFRVVCFQVMTPLLTRPRTKLSTRDGKRGQKRLDTLLKLWKVIQKRITFPPLGRQ